MHFEIMHSHTLVSRSSTSKCFHNPTKEVCNALLMHSSKLLQIVGKCFRMHVQEGAHAQAAPHRKHACIWYGGKCFWKACVQCYMQCKLSSLISRALVHSRAKLILFLFVYNYSLPCIHRRPARWRRHSRSRRRACGDRGEPCLGQVARPHAHSRAGATRGIPAAQARPLAGSPATALLRPFERARRADVNEKEKGEKRQECLQSGPSF